MRDTLLAGTAGVLFSYTAAFAVHRSLWKAADQHSHELDDLAGKPPPTGSQVPKRKLKDSFEGFILRRFGHWWNAGVDNVHARMVGLPDTVEKIVEDVKGKEVEGTE